MRTSLCLLTLATVAAGLGCNRDKPAASGGSGSAAPAPAPAPAPSGSPPTAAAPAVEIFVNDLSVGTVSPTLLAGWPRLDSLVPGDARRLGTWELVSLQGVKPAPTDLSHPSTAYPDMVPAIFPGPGGAASFGMFDPVELAHRGKPAMREDNLKAIRIKFARGGTRGQNDDGAGSGGDPTALVLTVTTPAATTKLSGEKLLALPREPMPGNPDQKGWRLAALLDAAGVKTYQRLVLTGEGGANLTLDKADLSDTSVPFIKLNKQGALRLRVFKKVGDGWNSSGDLRALVAVDVK
jgi:hypothetical protein